MRPNTLQEWSEHRNMTASSLSGNTKAFHNKYGYVPKAVFHKQRRGKFRVVEKD